jgi:hypothetical protein
MTYVSADSMADVMAGLLAGLLSDYYSGFLSAHSLSAHRQGGVRRDRMLMEME